MTGLVPFQRVMEAAGRLNGQALRTPLLPSPHLSEDVGADVRLKAECLQRTGSFKFRGAFNFLAAHVERDATSLDRGVITYSSGNHAQAVALAARIRGVPAVVVMPVDAPRVKRMGAEALGARIVAEGRTSEERRARAEAIGEAQGLLMVPPFDHPDIIAGQGTSALEAADDWPELDTWVVCLGGGGFASGSAVALRERRPGARIIGVEAEGAASMRASLDAGTPVTLDTIDTIADGLAPVRPGDLTFRHVQALFDDVVTVSDDAIREAATHLLLRDKLVVEFSGAAAVAAVRSGQAGDLSGRHVGVTLSGSNIDPAVLAGLLDGHGDRHPAGHCDGPRDAPLDGDGSGG